MFDSHSFDRGSNDNEHEGLLLTCYIFKINFFCISESDNEQTESATSSEL